MLEREKESMVIPHVSVPAEENTKLLQIYKNKLEQQKQEILELRNFIEDLKNENHQLKLQNVEKMVRNQGSKKNHNLDLLQIELEEAQ